MKDDDDDKPTPADIQAIIDAARDFAELMDRLADAYRRKCDWKECMALLDKLFYIEKESVH